MTGDGQIMDALCRSSPWSLLTMRHAGRRIRADAWELGCNSRVDSGAVY